MSKLPAIQFYPGDWRKDVGVQSLTFNDRGVWFEMLLLMHESERRGVLVLNGRAMPEDALARLLGLDKKSLTTTIATLLEHGVASRDEGTGALLSRRMVRDESLRAVRAECGKLGGNPQLKKKAPRNLDKQNATTELKQKPTPSSSISTSLSTSEEEKHSSASGPKPPVKRKANASKSSGEEFALPDWIHGAAWDAFVEMRKHIKSPLDTTYAKKLLIGKLADLRAEGHDPKRVIEQSIANGWKGFFGLKDDSGINGGRGRQTTTGGSYGRRFGKETGSERQQRIDDESDASNRRLLDLVGARPASQDGVLEARR